ncbi:hypothetical protein L7F22_001089 [Adiantum nelumboides]|nr:hypothetical protein [Adiantum nelumboides]
MAAERVWIAPAWLAEFLAADFKCTKKVKKNVFCIACLQVLQQENAEAHAASAGHLMLQVGKTSNALSLRVSQLAEGSKKDLLDVERIQQYRINGHLILYLHQRPIKGLGATPLGSRPDNRCCCCTRLLMDSADKVKYCSIECKWRFWLGDGDGNNIVQDQPPPDRNNGLAAQQVALEAPALMDMEHIAEVQMVAAQRVALEAPALLDMEQTAEVQVEVLQSSGLPAGEAAVADPHRPEVANAWKHCRKSGTSSCRASLGNTFAHDQL